MKKLVHLGFVVLALAMFAGKVSAQKTAEFCSNEAPAKVALYQKFLANYKLTGEQQKQADEFANEYLNRYGGCADEGDEKVTRFIRKWLALYAKVVREFDCRSVAYHQQWARAFEVCQVLVNESPESTEWPLLLTLAGYSNLTSGANLTGSRDKSLNAEAAKMARRAVELIEAGRALPHWNPFAGRDEAIGFLYYAQGVFLFESAPADAAAAFLKTAESNSSFRREATTYAYLASLYETNELQSLIAEYRKNFAPPEAIPPKSQYDATAAGINKTLDRIIDGYARALSIMNSNPRANQKLKASVTQQLTSYYKQRHQDSEAGLTELIAGVLETPLPVKQ